MHKKVWITEEDDEFKLKLLTIGHAEVASHCGGEANADVLREQFV